MSDRYVVERSEVGTGRWIDFLMAYAVDAEMLLDRNGAYNVIKRKKSGGAVLAL